MGEYYKYVELGGIPYIEYQSHGTQWQTKVKELSYEEFDKINEFMCKQHDDKNLFFKQIVGE